MKKELHLSLSPREAYDPVVFRATVLKHLGLTEDPSIVIRPTKRSIDARSKHVVINVSVEIFINEAPSALISASLDYPEVKNKPSLVIIGAGPAGLFAALRAIEL